MVPDLQSAAGGVVHGQPPEQDSDSLLLLQYWGAQTLSTNVQAPQLLAFAAG